MLLKYILKLSNENMKILMEQQKDMSSYRLNNVNSIIQNTSCTQILLLNGHVKVKGDKRILI